jgi:hypothetical protein
MTLIIRLDHEDEKITNLNVADAVIELCEEYPYALKPVTIAKAILLENGSEDTE